ncbi:MAG: hypothetical protein M0014_12180 [Actinomycetota bacterium]|jgi:hypothetical protein|nr:hypothetical protein [Actinomycetota bacterium]
MNSSHEELPPTANEVREAKLGVRRAAAWLVHLSDTSAGMPSAATSMFTGRWPWP